MAVFLFNWHYNARRVRLYAVLQQFPVVARTYEILQVFLYTQPQGADLVANGAQLR